MICRYRVSYLTVLILGLMLVCPSMARSADPEFSNSIGMEFVRIPAGTFQMGSPVSEPYREPSETRHRVTITQPFYMQTTEVTVGQWQELMGKSFFSPRKGSSNQPVTRVSWHDCMKFIKRLNELGEGTYRLPTEAEWEYAARAGSDTAFHWGNKISCSNAMYSNNTMKSADCVNVNRSRGLPVNQPAPVKSYPPNAWGLYDMHGNVWEWCFDWLEDFGSMPVSDPFGPVNGTMRIRRGGSWYKHGYSLRSANRAGGHPASRLITTGFRVVMDSK